MKVIVGLGNPGIKYAKTRHNIGFRVIDQLAKSGECSCNADFKLKEDFFSLISEGLYRDEKVLLVKPQTYMNNSGKAVAAVVKFFNITPADLLVISDDFNLPFGELRFRRQGSSGGHNGLKSIIAALSSDEFPRLRIGIGLSPALEPAAYVLQKFSEEESKIVGQLINNAAEAISLFLQNGIEIVMNKYN